MSSQALTDPGSRPPLGERRTRTLELLRAADAPVSVQDIADGTGLHPNTARFHLDGLVEAGLAVRANEDGGKPGRPRALYSATTADAGTGGRSYQLLAEMLTGMLTEVVEQPTQAAAQAGREWGRYLVERPSPSQHVDTADALRRLRTLLAEAGFAPDPASHEDGETILGLRQCPFREVADRHRDVVCSLHLGLMQGALAEVRAPVTAASLDPFVEPSLCVTHLRTTER